MKIKLLAPRSSLNWLLVAEDLEDPANWSVFLLNHGPNTQRYQFEEYVSQISAEKNTTLTPVRLLCKRNICTLEYAWNTELDTIRSIAQYVAERLSAELELPIAQVPSLAG